MKRRVTTKKSCWKIHRPVIGDVAATGARQALRVEEDPLVASIHRISLTDLPVDLSELGLKSEHVLVEIVPAQTFSTKITRSASMLQIIDSRVLRSVPTAGVC